jgi:ATP-dependent Lhr-like helicase
VADWFARAFARPTPPQTLGWPHIASGHHTLIVAPTGSGKTLAAFLWGLNQIAAARLTGDDHREAAEAVTGASPGVGRGAGRILYISPLKALNYDVERNLRGPLAGIAESARRMGLEPPEISVAVRTGDTPQSERQRMLRNPPDILITTPESLYLLLTSKGEEILKGVTGVIVDEIHAMAGAKRGSHLALSMERLERVAEQPVQRIGLSATQRPISEIARFLGGQDADGTPRPVSVVDAGRVKELDLQVIVPVDDMREMAEPGRGPADGGGQDLLDVIGGGATRRSIWPAMYPALLDLVRAHRSTLIFVNNRRSAERLALRLNELAEEEVARAHHGSLAREQRTLIEEDLKAGRIPALVATSSLELGVDMGAIDLVVQVESPRSVARGIQRVGRAGHRIDVPSVGRIFPKYRGDLLECAAVVERMRAGDIEETHIPRLPLDVLAQQVVAMVSGEEPMTVEGILAVARGSHPFADLSRDQLEGVLDMLAGRYPSDEFAELKPRVVWDRAAGTVRGRDGARRLAVENAGTIPDRGLFGVFLADGRTRVGELDEEMVYEARAGQAFMLGASTWRIEQITRDRVLVSPAPGAPGAVPFWRGEGVGRPYELGAAVGRMARDLAAAEPDEAAARLREASCFDDRAAANLVQYVRDQVEATGTVPSDIGIVVERFRDEIGDWRLCVLSPFGARVHAPWALAIQARLREVTGTDPHVIWSDDGIACHVVDGDTLPPTDVLLPDPSEVEDLILGELGGTALFGSRFRENAARALLIPRRHPGRRTPLWQQRLKASSLLEVARRFGSFPVILETYRECLNDWFDMPSLRDLLGRIQSREVSVTEVETDGASPFAGSLLFEYVASYMYDDDTPAAERRAQALALDRDLLRELLGQDELRELIDPDALDDLEAQLQGLGEHRARGADGVHDLLRRLGDLTAAEVTDRLEDGVALAGLVDQLERERRAARARVAGEERLIAAEDAGRYRDGLGVMPPAGLPDAFLEPVPRALEGLLARYARTHGPFRAGDAARRLGASPGLVESTLGLMEAEGGLVRGQMRPGGSGEEWCDPEVLRRLRRMSMARLRREVEPTDPEVLARFLPRWQRIDHPDAAPGPDALRDVISGLQGIALPARQWEAETFPRRLGSYSPAWLDQLAAAGEIAWIGAGSLGSGGGGRVALYLREDAAVFGPPPADAAPEGEAADHIRAALRAGAQFLDDLIDIAGAPRDEAVSALWELVWAGEVTNDLWTPLRSGPRGTTRAATSRSPRGRTWGRTARGRGGRAAAAGGRWASTAPLLERAPSVADRRRALAEVLLDRHGIVTRGAVIGEGIPGGFSAVYPELGQMETLGLCRRGYFVEHLGGAQFALPGAIDRLRDLRPDHPPGEDPDVLIIGAADPAQPYGASLPWPRREGGRSPSRVFGAQVVLADGVPIAHVERGGKTMMTLVEPGHPFLEPALAALVRWVNADRVRRLRIERIDGGPAADSPARPAMERAGFRVGYRGLEAGA